MSSSELSPTSYLVLGLLSREGPSTSYALKRHAAAALGNFWSFPHAVLYAEPPRLARRGLATEMQERNGRRRTFSITDKGVAALRNWLAIPSDESPELRDPGLLHLFFADLGSSAAGAAIAHDQLAITRQSWSATRRRPVEGGSPDRFSGLADGIMVGPELLAKVHESAPVSC